MLNIRFTFQQNVKRIFHGLIDIFRQPETKFSASKIEQSLCHLTLIKPFQKQVALSTP